MLLLNDSGDDLIYETPGDAERGNPLDIITVATCYTCEDVTGEAKFQAKETVKRMATAWNCHDDLVEAVRQLLKHVEADESIHGRPFAAGKVGRAALSRVKKNTNEE